GARELSAPSDVGRQAAAVARGPWDFRMAARLFAVGGASAQARLAIRMRAHPMAGGTWRVRRDRLAEYVPARRRVFGLDRLPLPASLALSPADEATNRKARLAV